MKEEATIKASFDSIGYKNFSLEGGKFDLELIKESDKNYLAAVGGIYLDTLKLSPKLVLDSVNFDVEGQGNIFKSDLKTKQSNEGNFAILNMETRLYKGE